MKWKPRRCQKWLAYIWKEIQDISYLADLIPKIPIKVAVNSSWESLKTWPSHQRGWIYLKYIKNMTGEPRWNFLPKRTRVCFFCLAKMLLLIKRQETIKKQKMIPRWSNPKLDDALHHHCFDGKWEGEKILLTAGCE